MSGYPKETQLHDTVWEYLLAHKDSSQTVGNGNEAIVDYAVFMAEAALDLEGVEPALNYLVSTENLVFLYNMGFSLFLKYWYKSTL